MRDRVEVLGWITGADKLTRLQQAAVFALPSFSEGLPMGLLEAMAAGLPVLATPVGGIPEVITDGVEGFLVDPGDVGALTDRLSRLLSDENLRGRMGRAARHKAEALFTVDVILPQLEQLYTRLGATPCCRPVPEIEHAR
jgi:glycosyltransferase involved in cell wall biosynthesis